MIVEPFARTGRPWVPALVPRISRDSRPLTLARARRSPLMNPLSAGAGTDKPAEIGLAPLQVRDIADAGGLDTLADALAKAMDKRAASRRQRLVSRRGTGVVEVTMESAQPTEATG